MGRPGKGMTISLALRTKNPNTKQKSRCAITEITKQDFRKILKKFNNSPYLDYNSKQFHNKPTDDYLFLIKYITKIIKSKRHVQLSTIFLSGVNKIIGHINKTIGHASKAIQSYE